MALLPPPRPRVYRLSPGDLERSLDDPGLAALAAEGWTTAGLVAAADGERPVVLLVLWPPAARTSPDRTRELVGLSVAVVLLLAVALCVVAAA